MGFSSTSDSEYITEGPSPDGFGSLARALFGNIRQKFYSAEDKRAAVLSTLSLGECQLTKINAPRHGVFAPMAAKQSTDADSIKILLQLSGRSRLHLRDSRINLIANESVIYDPTSPYSMINSSPVNQVILQLPRHMFDDRLLRRLSSPIHLKSDSLNLTNTLSSFIKTSATSAATMTPEMRSTLGHSLTVFTQGVVGEAFRTEMVSVVNQGSLLLLRERIAEFIAQNLCEADLSIDMIARHMGCSARYLHKAFQSEETTVSRLILDMRLDRCREMLSQPAAAGMTVSEIAFQVGFNSSAHFSRAFKQRFEMTPNEVRNMQLARQEEAK